MNPKSHHYQRETLPITTLGLAMLKYVYEQIIVSCLGKQLRQELEKIRRRLEMELADTREQLMERTAQLEDLQAQVNKREEDLQQTLNKYVHKNLYR